jgi:type III secretion protein U
LAEKSEKATPKKLRDARKKGQVAKSQDFPAAFTFATSILLVVTLAPFMYHKMGEFLIATFKATSSPDLRNALGHILEQALVISLVVTLPIAGLVAFVGVVVNFLIIGPTFASKAMIPDPKRLNPVTGLRNKFRARTWVELLKSLIKVGIAAYLVYTVVYGALPTLIQTAGIPLMATVLVVAEFLKKVAIRVGLFFLAVSIFDLAYQKRVFAKDMKMEKFEVKQEQRDLEGDPHIKGRRRQLAQEVAYEEGPTAARRARVVVTNPEHIAVAIGYEPEKFAAPFILTMGIGTRAEYIIVIAQEHHIPIMRNVGLARQLFEQGRVNRFIPEESYEAVAEILRWVISLESE